MSHESPRPGNKDSADSSLPDSTGATWHSQDTTDVSCNRWFPRPPPGACSWLGTSVWAAHHHSNPSAPTPTPRLRPRPLPGPTAPASSCAISTQPSGVEIGITPSCSSASPHIPYLLHLYHCPLSKVVPASRTVLSKPASSPTQCVPPPESRSSLHSQAGPPISLPTPVPSARPRLPTPPHRFMLALVLWSPQVGPTPTLAGLAKGNHPKCVAGNCRRAQRPLLGPQHCTAAELVLLENRNQNRT